MFFIIIFGLGSLFVSGQIPQNTPQPVRRMPDLPLPAVSLPAGKNFVRLPLEASGKWMIILVSVKGSRALRFIPDSGASGTIFYKDRRLMSLVLK